MPSAGQTEFGRAPLRAVHASRSIPAHSR